jgi:hypothetical protein
MKMIPEARRAWRMLSVQMAALLVAWSATPEPQQAALLKLLGVGHDTITGTLAALAILGRLVYQPRVHE